MRRTRIHKNGPMEKRKGLHPRVQASVQRFASASGGNDVLGLRALLALGDVEGNLLAFLKLAEARRGDVRVVGEHVSAAALLLDEAEALFRVEPLHGARCHIESPLGQYPESAPCRPGVAVAIYPARSF